jgi:hypothetical protein
MANTTDMNNRPLTGSVIIDGTSYSGADIKVVVHIYDQYNATDARIAEVESNLATPGLTENARLILSEELVRLRAASYQKTKVLAELQTLSVSTYREKYPVRACSTVYPKGFTRGPRTIAGSMVFSVFDKNVLYELLKADASEFDSYRTFTSALIDQLPPFDITIAFANELGQTSRMSIYGVEFVSEGQTMSVHDLFIENQCQYLARDIDPMTKEGDARRDEHLNITAQNMFGSSTASSLLRSKEAKELKNLLDPFGRYKTRSDPFK